jgi:chorismate mutase
MSDEVARFRAEIGEVDRELLDAINRRLELVRDLKRYKEEHGIAFVDRSREAELLEERVRQNQGPLSEAGVRAFFVELLALIKREL